MSKQWLGHRPETLRLPSMALNDARNWAEFNRAADNFLIPAQNLLYLDRQGSSGYRLSGVGPRRRLSGLMPQPAAEGEWTGLRPVDERPRLEIQERLDTSPTWTITANQEIWYDPYGHRFFGEERAGAIKKSLTALGKAEGGEGSATWEDMARIQQDPHVAYLSQLAAWLLRNADARLAGAVLNSDFDPALTSKSHPELMERLVIADSLLQAILNARLKDHFFAGIDPGKVPEYRWRSRFGSFTAMMATDEGFAVLGLKSRDLADTVLRGVQQRSSAADEHRYPVRNAWAAQHPFVGRVPIIEELYRLPAFPQYGHDLAINVEDGAFGASVRLIWDLKDPGNSRWSLPIGQSGHLGIRFFANFHEDWHQGIYRRVLPEDWERSQH